MRYAVMTTDLSQFTRLIWVVCCFSWQAEMDLFKNADWDWNNNLAEDDENETDGAAKGFAVSIQVEVLPAEQL